jgi:pyruvate dehydrogenase E2 component (dihydrolipoamide acetyltransferase)
VCIITENQSDVGAFADFKDDMPAAPAAATAETAAPVIAPPAPTAPMVAPAQVVAPVLTPAAPVPAATPAWSGGERVFASPLARRLAAEKGLDLAVWKS